MTMTPWMRNDEVEAISKLLEKYKPKSVLEYGCGGSTTYFPSNHKFIARWLSIEHDKTWLDKTRPECPSSVELKFVPNVREPYVNSTGDEKFDLVFVDGRYRVACLLDAKSRLKENGIVLLHDASRVSYEKGTSIYKHKEKLTDGNGKHQGLLILWN